MQELLPRVESGTETENDSGDQVEQLSRSMGPGVFLFPRRAMACSCCHLGRRHQHAKRLSFPWSSVGTDIPVYKTTGFGFLATSFRR